MTPAALAIIGFWIAVLIAALVVVTMAICSGDSEEMGRVIPGRWK
jgi:hypothetical protein